MTGVFDGCSGRILSQTISFLTIISVSALSGESNIPDENKVYHAGKAQYENIVGKSEMPRFGRCWKLALSRATTGCKHLTNTMTHQLAYDFTRCFYLELGQEIPECAVLPEECKGHLEANILHGTYAMFFMHTRDMCYFLENQAWQERTQETVVQLSDSSQKVVERLESAQGLQEMIAAGQEETLARQQSILDGSDSLSNKISTMEIGVVGLLNEFQQTYSDQMMAVGQVFDKITSLENIFLAEYTGTQAFLLWLGAMLISYLASSTPRTYAARFPLFLLTAVFSLLELTVLNHSVSRLLCQVFERNSALLFTDATVCIYLCTKTWRWLYGACNVSILLYCAMTYEDYDTKIYRALMDLQQEIKIMKATYSQPSLIAGVLTSSNGNVAGSIDSAQGQAVSQDYISHTAVSTKCEAVNTFESDSGGSTSGSDCDSDATYQTPSSSGSMSSVGTELSDLSISELGSGEVTMNEKPSPLKQTLLERTADFYSLPGRSRYNLRPRNLQSTPKVFIDETERQFVRAVKQLTNQKSRFPNSSYVL